MITRTRLGPIGVWSAYFQSRRVVRLVGQSGVRASALFLLLVDLSSVFTDLTCGSFRTVFPGLAAQRLEKGLGF